MPLPAWAVAAIVSVVLNVAAMVIAPKPKQPKPEAVRDIETPTASAGRPIPRIWGTMTVKSPNILWYGEKSTREYQVKL